MNSYIWAIISPIGSGIDDDFHLPSVWCAFGDKSQICETIIDGDAKLLSIAAASILAKETHDDWVRVWCSENSEMAERYDLMSCKGYGTAKHRAGILKHGYLETHRRLYLRKLVPGIVVQRCQLLGDEEE